MKKWNMKLQRRMKMNTTERYEKGLENLLKIDGHAGEVVMRNFSEFAPDLMKHTIEYSFGDIYSREILDLKSKEIAVVAALIALGNAEPQLKVHFNAGLNVGCTINELKEIVLQMSGYAGFPASINAMNALMCVLETRKGEGHDDVVGQSSKKERLAESEKYEFGASVLNSLKESQVKRLEGAYNDFAPELVTMIVNNYADHYDPEILGKRERQIATISALSAMGCVTEQLKFHIESGLNVGLMLDEVKEIMMLQTVYSGFPAALNGMNAIKAVMENKV